MNLFPQSILTKPRLERQEACLSWAISTFGDLSDVQTPAARARYFLEEALELAQAAGLTQETAEMLVKDTFSRPVGEVGQEIGGCAVTLMCFAEAAGYSLDYEEVREMTRILEPSFTERARAKHCAKIARGVA